VRSVVKKVVIMVECLEKKMVEKKVDKMVVK
jgi:hypothetical protein